MNDLNFYQIGTVDLGKGIYYCKTCKLASFTGKPFNHVCKGEEK